MRGLTPDDYITAGFELLAEHGAGALTLSNVCDRLRITKGSFYHHFPSLPAFHAALLDTYSVDLLERATELARAEADPRVRLAVLRQLGVEMSHELEHQIRAWGASYGPAAVAQDRVDRARHELLVETFQQLGIDERRARTLARIGTSIVAGVQDLEHKVDREALDEVLTEYQRWIEASIPGA